MLRWLKNVIYVFMSTKLLLLFSKGTVQVLGSELRGGIQGEILGYNSAENWFDMVVEKNVLVQVVN